ncbi:ArsR/SmtB family transcription factor [Candidatus Neomarinimicrobiota bacterium]
MIERSSNSSKVSMPVLEGTQNFLAGLKDISGMVHTFSLLGDLTRMRILLSLANARELCVSDLSDILGMETSAISHQLRKLKDGGLIVNKREGAMVYYKMKTDALREVFATARSLLG